MTGSHVCQDTSLTLAITNFLARNPQEWAKLQWACLYCGGVNQGVDALCARPNCRDEMGTSRRFVLENILTKVGIELALLPEVDVATEIWPVGKAMEVILSPHNRAGIPNVSRKHNQSNVDF